MLLIVRIIKGIGFALSGFAFALGNDRHFRVNLVLSMTGVLLSLIFLEGCERIFVAFFNYLVLVVETVNTAIERAVDVATQSFHPLAKASKDISAAAVLLTGLFAVAIDIVYLLPVLWRILIVR